MEDMPKTLVKEPVPLPKPFKPTGVSKEHKETWAKLDHLSQLKARET